VNPAFTQIHAHYDQQNALLCPPLHISRDTYSTPPARIGIDIPITTGCIRWKRSTAGWAGEVSTPSPFVRFLIPKLGNPSCTRILQGIGQCTMPILDICSDLTYSQQSNSAHGVCIRFIRQRKFELTFTGGWEARRQTEMQFSDEISFRSTVEVLVCRSFLPIQQNE
jgi:hypothetical protein